MDWFTGIGKVPQWELNTELGLC
jgi:hypothetical protein